MKSKAENIQQLIRKQHSPKEVLIERKIYNTAPSRSSFDLSCANELSKSKTTAAHKYRSYTDKSCIALFVS